MAYDKIITVRSRLDHCVDYVLNHEKTDMAAVLDYIGQQNKNTLPDGRSVLETAINCNLESAYQDMQETKRRWRQLEELGYTVKRGPNIKHTAVKLPGGQRFFRLDGLGDGYTEADILARLSAVRSGEAPPPVSPGPSFRPIIKPLTPGRRYRPKGGVPGRPRKLKGFRALYFKYLYLLGAVPKRRPKKRAAFVSRAEIIKFDHYAEVPMPPSGRWANAGMVRGDVPDLSWRLMDAQYWSIPRLARRQRIFIVADFGGRRAHEILFKPRPMFQVPPPCGKGGLSAAPGDRGLVIEAGGRVPIVRPFQLFRMRGAAKDKYHLQFRDSFGFATDPFPTLLASTVNPFAFYYEDDPLDGCIRYVTETESERLMGLPEGWTAYGAEGETISSAQRYQALGNAISLPCAEYIMAGIKEVLARPP